MNVTKEGIKYRQLQIEDYLQMVSAEQKEYAEEYASSRITENNITDTDMSKDDLLEKILDRNNLNQEFEKVKSNRGAGGIDGVDFEIFEKRLNNNLYKIWNRMSSGSYFPAPVLAVEIPKKSGGVRRLGIPTITDRIAQMVVRMYVEPVVEPMFCDDSYGYRPNKSALDAIAMTRQRCWKYNYVIELYVKGLFDNIDHKLLMKVMLRHVKEEWVCLYINRWLKTPFVIREGQMIERNAGTPQGGAISPVLANMFLHYVFDIWMKRNFPQTPFERYALKSKKWKFTKEQDVR